MSLEEGEGISQEEDNGTLGGGRGDLKPKMQFSPSSEFSLASVFL